MDMFLIFLISAKSFLISAKSNDITKKILKSILVQKIAYTYIYDISMSPEQFEIKNKEIMVKYRQLSTVPLNFDYSRVWQ